MLKVRRTRLASSELITTSESSVHHNVLNSHGVKEMARPELPKPTEGKRYDMMIGLCIRPTGQDRWYDYGSSYADVPIEMITIAQSIIIKHQAALDKVLEDMNMDLMQLGMARIGQLEE